MVITFNACTPPLSASKGEKMWVAHTHCRAKAHSMAHLLVTAASQVLESWRMVLRGEFQIKLENVRVHATQDTGYVTCVEVMNAGNAKGR